MESVRLFPKVIGIFTNPDISYHKKIVEKCYRIKKKVSSGGKNWRSNIYNTSGKVNLYTDNDFKPLLKWVDDRLLEYSFNLKIDFKPVNKNAWFQIYSKDDYKDYHSHPTARLSAVYYLKGKANSSPTIFTDFNFNMNCFSLITPTEDNSREWSIPFQEGVLLIFRSEIPHCVPKNLNSERISIAINYNS